MLPAACLRYRRADDPLWYGVVMMVTLASQEAPACKALRLRSAFRSSDGSAPGMVLEMPQLAAQAIHNVVGVPSYLRQSSA